MINEHYNSDGDNKWIYYHVKAGNHNPITFKSDFEDFCNKEIRDNSKTIKSFTEAFFRFCYGKGDYLLGDKTPEYGAYMENIIDIWTDAKFIHLIRDGRYAATSIQKHLGFVRCINAGRSYVDIDPSYKRVQASWSTKQVSLIECIKYWQKNLVVIREESKKIPTEAYLEVRYEDLILHPTHELRKIAKFLGVPITRGWILRASGIPKPLSLLNEKKRLTLTQYEKLTEEVNSTLQSLGYPCMYCEIDQILRIKFFIKGVINFILYRLVLFNLLRIGRLLKRM
ncbi:MAG: sulfotransferase [Calditrichaeota bacterium]|nr:sulfotransferase [Calditrichota bacterium]